MSKPLGHFLIRVSESRVGYTLSYRAEGRCRHFMIDAKEDGSYGIVGEGRCHLSLQQLVDYHRKIPITPYKELLTASCGQTSHGASKVEKKTSEELSPPEEERNSHTPPDTPVPKTRKRYSTDVNPLPPPNAETDPAPSCQDHPSTTPPDRSPQMKPESEEMTWEQLFDAVLRPYMEESERLPQEYSPPPPFAPGYRKGGP
ncbi:hematopoietic SH2 domain-containing protein homolog isoform X2 [Dunckerocampus dactyliophorus]|nr:hematopoietic SH2 domain-containing protein homolog isoform X2 [Dunckerocampus dactyliophorus]